MANKSDSFSDDTRFSAKSIRNALESLAPDLGKSNVDSLISGIEAFGLQLSDENNYYTVAELRQALNDLFSDAGPLIFQSIKKSLLESQSGP